MKKNKKFYILIISIVVLAILLGLLYVIKDQLRNDRKEIVVEKKETKLKDKKVVYAGYTKMNKEASLYKKNGKKFKKIGKVKDDGLVNLAETNEKENDYYQLSNSDYYIFYKDIDEENATDKFNNSYLKYLVFNENVVTNDITKLYTSNNELKYTINEGIDLPIYMKRDGMMYVVYMNELLGVRQDECSVRANVNSDKVNAKQVPVFMYHFFYDAQAQEPAGDGNFVEIHTFREQLSTAKQMGYQSISMSDLDLYLDGSIQLPQGSFAVTMDDNAESVKRLAYPVLEELQINATNFVITSWTSDFESIKSPFIELQSHSDAMHTGGCSGQKHGGLFNCIDYDNGIKDVTTSRDKLGGAFVFCYPFGDVNDNMKTVLRDSGYRLAFTTAYGYVAVGMDKLQLPRVRITQSTNVAAFTKLLEG